eukprot:10200537-Heterocapsa_arctica.AAC.1
MYVYDCRRLKASGQALNNAKNVVLCWPMPMPVPMPITVYIYIHIYYYYYVLRVTGLSGRPLAIAVGFLSKR